MVSKIDTIIKFFFLFRFRTQSLLKASLARNPIPNPTFHGLPTAGFTFVQLLRTVPARRKRLLSGIMFENKIMGIEYKHPVVEYKFAVVEYKSAVVEPVETTLNKKVTTLRNTPLPHLNFLKTTKKVSEKSFLCLTRESMPHNTSPYIETIIVTNTKIIPFSLTSFFKVTGLWKTIR